jgi:membrane protein DedA with SNARE-associated domain
MGSIVAVTVDTTEVAEAYGLGGRPFVVVLVVLFVVVFLRSHATYWAGRALVRGAQVGQEKIGGPAWWQATVARMGRFAQSRAAQRGIALVHRWGPVAVVLAYLTVGVQTAVFLCAGMVRMPYTRFTAASVPGAALWAVIWGTVGLSAVYAGMALAARSPWAFAALLAAVAAVVAAFVVRSRRRRAAQPARAAAPLA